MRFKIQETLSKTELKKGTVPQFIERDFKDQAAAELYAEGRCKSWKKIEITEV